MKLVPLVMAVSLIFLAACNKPADQASQHLMLVFGDQEEGVDPYKTRILVTPDFMRFDDGEGAVDYLVFDRRKKAIYSVVQDSKSVTVITSEKQEVQPPFALKLSNKKIADMQDAPTMEGTRPQHHVFMSGEEICYEVLSVPDFLPAFIEAMQEFNTVLAYDSAMTLSNLPADMQNGCSLAKSIFAPNRHFKVGFPLQLWSPDGSSSVLLDFKRDHKADKTLFEIPASYSRLNIQEIRTNLSNK